jgi:hypothetical protein
LPANHGLGVVGHATVLGERVVGIQNLGAAEDLGRLGGPETAALEGARGHGLGGIGGGGQLFDGVDDAV